ncbi:MAG: OB-fold nucleic acid binding domain-containing protein [bacterium]
MFKKTFLFPVVLIILASCNQTTNDSADKKPYGPGKITVATFLESAPEWINKDVIIEGAVSHICKHGGKRMFLVDGNDSVSVEIVAGPDITKFEEALVGSRVKVSGILKEDRIDEKYLSEWENEIKKPQPNHDVGVHTGAKGHMDQTAQDKLDQIAAYRADLKSSGQDHLSFYSLEANKVEELK